MSSIDYSNLEIRFSDAWWPLEVVSVSSHQKKRYGCARRQFCCTSGTYFFWWLELQETNLDLLIMTHLSYLFAPTFHGHTRSDEKLNHFLLTFRPPLQVLESWSSSGLTLDKCFGAGDHRNQDTTLHWFHRNWKCFWALVHPYRGTASRHHHQTWYCQISFRKVDCHAHSRSHCHPKINLFCLECLQAVSMGSYFSLISVCVTNDLLLRDFHRTIDWRFLLNQWFINSWKDRRLSLHDWSHQDQRSYQHRVCRVIQTTECTVKLLLQLYLDHWPLLAHQPVFIEVSIWWNLKQSWESVWLMVFDSWLKANLPLVLVFFQIEVSSKDRECCQVSLWESNLNREA